MQKIKEKLNLLNKSTIIVMIITIIAVLVLAGTSLAMFFTSKTSSNQDMYKTGDLLITFAEDSSSKISLTNQYPMSDDAGKKTTPYTFSITNEGDYNVSYAITLVPTTTALATSVKYQINGSNPKNLTTGSPDLDVGSLIPGETKTFELRLWIDENATTTAASKSYAATISVSGYAVPVPYFRDNSGANAPTLASGMIPVVYDGVRETWVVADKARGWYNYSDHVWANAVTVTSTNRTTYQNANPGTPIPMDDINSMWVWIPRYKYKIPSNIGSSENVTEPPEISVIFESGTNTTGESLEDCPIDDTTCYYTHPAFRNGSSVYNETPYDIGGWSKELTGIWVGKFDTSGNATTPTIKPDITFLASQNASTQFDTSLKFSGGTRNTSTGAVTFAGNTTYGLTSSTDTHMMKNTEWGAVAYLSQSRCGKMGNSNYNDKEKEIYINNSSSYYTGRSGGGPGGSTPINETYNDQTSTTQNNAYGFYTYDDYLLNYNTNTKGNKVLGKGTGASTTGTIYGIYDMIGLQKYTMANWFGTATMGTVGSSGFTTSNYPGGNNGSKYYDTYRGLVSADTKIKAIKGDATYETMRWYSDNPSILSSASVWGFRGGSQSSASLAGIFYTSGTSGASYILYSFRTVLIP